MVRGLYTGASGMAARIHQMDVVSNNLANVNKTAFKRDETVFKSFPEMVIRRQDDDGVRQFPLGSRDKAPVVGKIGTGVEVNEVYTHLNQGSLKATENPLDFALEGKGFFVVKSDKGLRYTRNGSFTINDNGTLVTKHGWPVMGKNGEIQIKHNNFSVNKKGEIWVDKDMNADSQRPVQDRENGFTKPVLIDNIKLVDFDFERHLEKNGDSFFKETEIAGAPRELSISDVAVKQGFRELSNVNAVREMVHMIEVQRSYEASQKTIQAHDGALNKLINSMAVV